MSILTMSNLAQNYGAFDLFNGISGTVPNDGKIGLVGPNGVGKTSLIQILTGQASPRSGELHISKQAKVGYLQQEAMQAFRGRETMTVHQEVLAIFDHLKAQAEELREMEAAMADGSADDDLFDTYSQKLDAFERAGGYDYRLRIEQVLDGLGFDRDNWDTPLIHLSGGQKTRALLARLLLEKPDLLILDEPTNHLDVEAIEWLEGTLKVWDGAVLLVSHDRYFLDRVVDTIWEMSATQIEVYRGNYSDYVKQRGERWERREKEYLATKERFEKELDYIKKNIAGQRTQMAQGKLSRLTRDLKAIEAGGMALLHSGKNWSQMGVGSQRPMSVAEAEERIKHLPRPTYRPIVPNLDLQPSHRSGELVLRTKNLAVGYPQATLFESDDIELRRLETAALIGPNGAGKTTFLKTILGNLEPLAGETILGASLNVAYFSQAHEALNLENTILDELIRHQHMLISEARDYLGQYLFRGEDVFKKVSTLSGGERGRLALAILALQDANFLLLDEPTNHLDVSSQELLEAVLLQYKGTILLVSHDRYLIDRLGTQIWAVRDGRLTVYSGNYQEYITQRDAAVQAQKAAKTAEREAAAQTAQTSVNGQKPKLSKNEQMRRQQAIEAVENQITAKEAELERVAQELQEASEAELFDKIQSKSIEYSTLENELESLLEEWEKIASE